MPVTAYFTGIGGPGNFLLVGADAGPASVKVKWGDGTTDTFVPPFSEGHFYSADGVYTIKVIETATGDSETLRAHFSTTDTLGMTVTGSGVDDLMSGGSGDDIFSGLGGDDWLFGGVGADTAYGGKGNDFLGGGGDTDVSTDTFYGEAGNDLLAGDAGDDLLDGGDDGDSVYGGSGKDTLYGRAGDDNLNGEDGDDKLYGGTGTDFMTGGAGKDTLTTTDDGVLDVFAFNAIDEGRDTIKGFIAGQDVIALYFIDQNTNPQLASGGTPAPSDTGVWILYDTDDGTLSVDLDGTGAGDAVTVATVKGVPTISIGDFWFGSPA